MTGGVQSPDFVVLFRARHRLGAMPLGQVQETMRPLPITPLAAMPAFFLGLSLIRGVAIPVVDAGAILEMDAPAKITRFITLRVGERHVALAVESVLGVEAISPKSLRQFPPMLGGASVEVISSLATLDAEFLLVLRALRLVKEPVESALEPQDA